MNQKHFFDGGANIGQTFDMFLDKTQEYNGWKIWCFEPSPRHLLALMSAAQKRSDKYEIVICPFGLYDEDGVSKFYQKQDPRGDSFLEKFYTDWDDVKNIHVKKLKEIPNLASSVSIYVPHVDIVQFIVSNIGQEDEIYLKLDIEGSEYRVLPRILRFPEVLRRIKKINVEWHSLNDDSKKQKYLCEQFKQIGKPLDDWCG